MEEEKKTILTVTDEQRIALAELMLLKNNIKELVLQSNAIKELIKSQQTQTKVVDKLIKDAKHLKCIANRLYSRYEFEIYVHVESLRVHVNIKSRLDIDSKNEIIKKIYSEYYKLVDVPPETRIYI